MTLITDIHDTLVAKGKPMSRKTIMAALSPKPKSGALTKALEKSVAEGSLTYARNSYSLTKKAKKAKKSAGSKSPKKKATKKDEEEKKAKKSPKKSPKKKSKTPVKSAPPAAKSPRQFSVGATTARTRTLQKRK